LKNHIQAKSFCDQLDFAPNGSIGYTQASKITLDSGSKSANRGQIKLMAKVKKRSVLILVSLVLVFIFRN
jgi:hypothetical protein